MKTDATAGSFRGTWVVVAGLLLATGVVVDRWQRREPGSSSDACPAAALLEGRGPTPAGDGMPHLLVFSSRDCPACARLAPSLAAVARDCAAPKDVVRHVDVDDDAGESLASAYRVNSLPTILGVDARGLEVSRLTGVQSAAAIEQAIERVRGARCASDEAPLGTKSR